MRFLRPTRRLTRQLISLSLVSFMYLCMLPAMPAPASRSSITTAQSDDPHRNIPLIAPGSATGLQAIRWMNNDGEVIASGWISADMVVDTGGLFCIRIGDLDQQIRLVTLPRHFGGRQWFFVCPVINCRASVLWLPRGAQQFASRHAWPGQVAYRSQFMTAIDRAYLGMERIKRRLIGDLDPQEWHLPPKPKWMRWRTYNHAVEKFERYESILDEGVFVRAVNLMGRG